MKACYRVGDEAGGLGLEEKRKTENPVIACFLGVSVACVCGRWRLLPGIASLNFFFPSNHKYSTTKSFLIILYPNLPQCPCYYVFSLILFSSLSWRHTSFNHSKGDLANASRS